MSGDETENPTRPSRAQRLTAFAFLGAFGLTIITVLLTGLWVRSPSAHRERPPVQTERAERPNPAPVAAGSGAAEGTAQDAVTPPAAPPGSGASEGREESAERPR